MLKKETYNKSNVEMTKALCKYEKWGADANNDREEALISSILEIWKF